LWVFRPSCAPREFNFTCFVMFRYSRAACAARVVFNCALFFRPSRRNIFQLSVVFSVAASVQSCFSIVGFWVCLRSPLKSSNHICLVVFYLPPPFSWGGSRILAFLNVAPLRPIAYPAPCRISPVFRCRVFCVFELLVRLRPEVFLINIHCLVQASPIGVRTSNSSALVCCVFGRRICPSFSV
jgi:hypothetical protein